MSENNFEPILKKTIPDILSINDIKFYQTDLTPGEQARFNRMIDKKNANGGVVIGYHGTSRFRAEKILKEGFQARHDRKIAGETIGVWAWDEEYKNNTEAPGVMKAEEDGDTEYAVFKLKMTNPQPDFLMGRPQWKGQPDTIEILDVEYFPIPKKSES